MKFKLVKTLLTFVCISFAMQANVQAAAEEPWERAIGSARRYQKHGQDFVNHVYQEISCLPAIYKTGSCSMLEGRLPEAGFDEWSVAKAAIPATQALVASALGQDAQVGAGLIKWVSQQVNEPIDWKAATVSGPIQDSILEVCTPIGEHRYLIFTANITSCNLEIEDAHYLGLINHKRIQMNALQGDYGVLFFSKDRAASVYAFPDEIDQEEREARLARVEIGGQEREAQEVRKAKERETELAWEKFEAQEAEQASIQNNAEELGIPLNIPNKRDELEN